MPAFPPPLLALSPGDLAAGDAQSFGGRLRRAAEAGLRGILVREPALDDRALLELARSAVEILRAAHGDGAWCGVHDRAHLVRAAGAQALHLGFRSLRPTDVPANLLDGALVGLSTHAGDAGRDAEAWEQVDYLFHGPVHETVSKQGLLEPIGFEGLARGVARSPVPVWALGGLHPEDVAAALDAGARGVAAIGALWNPEDPALSVGAFREAFERVGSSV